MPRVRTRSLALAALGLVVAVTAAVTVLVRQAGTPDGADPTRAISAEALEELRRPPAGWRPYSAASPFNRPLPGQPRVDPRSEAMVAQVLGDGPPDTLLTFDGSDARARRDDYARPIYFAGDGDPRFRVRCTDPSYPCRAGGDLVRLPEGARAAGGTDGHITVVDGDTEWSFFDVDPKRPRDGELRVTNGSSIPIDGTGLAGGGGAAGFGGLAGRIRWEPFRDAIERREALPFALFMTVRCARAGAFVPPAVDAEQKQACTDQENRPEMGRRFWLDMRPAEIEALDAPEWLKVIARTLATYGAFVGDQGGDSFGFQFESPEGFLALGQPNPFARYAARRPGRTVAGGGTYGYVLRGVIPWRERLRALAVPGGGDRSSP